MNRGDAGFLLLNIKIGGQPIGPSAEYITVNDLEVSFSASGIVLVKTLSKNEITWNPTEKKYQVFLSQEDTYKLTVGSNTWQVRIIRGEDVFSSRLGTLNVGPVLSDTILK